MKIKQKIKTLFKILIAFGGLILPFAASAQTEVQNGLKNNGLAGLFGFGGSGLAGSQTVTQLITNVVQLMLLFAGAVAIVFVIIGGYYYITSNGNEEAAEKGKKTLLNAIIGIVIILLSYAIISVISNLVGCQSVYGC